MNNSVIVQFIIELIEASRSTKNHSDNLDVEVDGNLLSFSNANYLLSQIIRQYRIPEENLYISQGAYDLWKMISEPGDSIWKYEYQDQFPYRTQNMQIGLYRGNEKKPYAVHDMSIPGKLTFNKIFHDEHVTDIKSIIKELHSLNQPVSSKEVVEILNKITIATILKEEDKRISKKSGRGCDAAHIINEVYGAAGITLIPMNSIESCTADNEGDIEYRDEVDTPHSEPHKQIRYFEYKSIAYSGWRGISSQEVSFDRVRRMLTNNKKQSLIDISRTEHFFDYLEDIPWNDVKVSKVAYDAPQEFIRIVYADNTDIVIDGYAWELGDREFPFGDLVDQIEKLN